MTIREAKDFFPEKSSIRKYLRVVCLVVATTLFPSCEETTGMLGIPSETDQITNDTATFLVRTRSERMDKEIVSNSKKCYFGRITDPETNSTLEADFAAQYQTFENYEFPHQEMMVDATDSTNIRYGVPKCESCDVRLYFEDYYGNGNNAMKMQVFELSSDSDRIFCEDSVYYTDIDLSHFLSPYAEPLASRWFSATDYDISEEERESQNYSNNVYVTLPASLGQRILDKFYEDKRNFQDSYHFIHNVFPGLYFRCSDGHGTMMKFSVSTLNLYFRYKEMGQDTIFLGMARFAATPEVIQSTRFSHTNGIDKLLEDSTWTYLKTPAGIATEMTLPIDEIFGGKHAIDSVSKATITLTRYNKQQEGFQFGIPSEILMVRKSEMHNFFQSKQTVNNRTNYITSFSPTYNTYTFQNISRLLSYCKHEKMNATKKMRDDWDKMNVADFNTMATTKGLIDKAGQTLTKDYWNNVDENEKMAIVERAWTNQNPDWNKVLLIPVVSTGSSTASATDQVGVTHNLDLNSIRLVGGTTPLKMQVVYSRFWQ